MDTNQPFILHQIQLYIILLKTARFKYPYFKTRSVGGEDRHISGTLLKKHNLFRMLRETYQLKIVHLIWFSVFNFCLNLQFKNNK